MIKQLPVRFLLLLFFWPVLTFSQVVINEFSPANNAEIIGPSGNTDDWIELYNAGSSTVDLTGFGLSDDAGHPYKFRFGSGELEPGDYAIVFASDRDFPYVIDHWELVIDKNDDWRYKPCSSQPDTNWRNLSFIDNSWNVGPGGFGFGDGDDNTTISQVPSVFMRIHFNVADVSNILTGVLHMDYDDGFVAYLNGVEIARANLGSPGTRLPYDFYASGSHEAHMYSGGDPEEFQIDLNLLKRILIQGDNVLAIQVHNSSSTSNDLSAIAFLAFGVRDRGYTYRHHHSWFEAPTMGGYEANFKLSRTGETLFLADSSGNVLDQRTFGNMQPDHSYGRKPDGSGSWSLFKDPTPGESNNSSTSYTGYCPAPDFSHQPGYYSSSFSLSASCSLSGATIRYTTDGSEPTSSSSSWSSNRNISSTTVVKARVYKSGYLPSEIISNTYFKNVDLELPVFSITTDPDNLWDYNTGIYEMGPNASNTSPYFGANFWQNWDRPARIEYFDKNKERQLSFGADIAIFGNYSRSKPQKSFEIKLDKSLESGSLDYALIPDKPFLKDFDNFVLRNSGTDWNRVHFKDAFLERVMKPTYSGYLATEPCNVYLNGEYWGVYCIYENHDQHWMRENYGYGKEEIDYLLESTDITTKLGSSADFKNMADYAKTANPSSSSYYETIASQLDIQNFTDYMIAETYFDNQDWMGDWTNNIKIWRPVGGKWKYLLYDLDYTVGFAGPVTTNTINTARNPASGNRTSDMFDAMLDNTEFRTYFVNRYADLINTIFLPDHLDDIKDSFKDSMDADMPEHFAKWGSSVSSWESKIDDMMDWLDDRPDVMRDFIKSEFGFSKKVTLELKVSPSNAGRVLINTIVPDSYPWEGVYFKGNPVTITAIPNPGYTFDHWRSNSVISSNDPNQTLTKNFTGSDVITAYFNGSSMPSGIVISEINYNSANEFNTGDWFELHNSSSVDMDLSGWSVKDDHEYNHFTFPVGTVIPANGYLVIAEDPAQLQLHFPNVTDIAGPMGFSLSNAGETIQVLDWQQNVVYEVSYSDDAPWPATADGDGYTCELLSITGNPSDGNNWFAGCYGGSPGAEYVSINASISSAGSTTICSGSTVQLNASSLPSYSYQWIVDGIDIIGANSNSYPAGAQGNYAVFISDQGCITLSNVITVQELPSPDVDLGADTALPSGSFLLLDAGAGFNSYLWSDNSTSQTILGFAGNTYSVIVTESHGCSSSDTIDIAVETGTESPGILEESVRIFPNPVADKLYYALQEPGEVRINLFDMAGRKLMEKTVHGGGGSIDMTDLPAGIYQVSFRWEDGEKHFRLVKE